jgi:glycosyltransferase involved in cell wall biosynthesis
MRVEAPRQLTRVSVIVAAYNQEDLIEELLSALVAQTWRGHYEVVVADNGSVDRTVEVARSFTARDPEVRVVCASRKRGQCAARNDGVVAAQGNLLLFVDGDDVPAADWIEQMVAAAAHADLVGGRLVVTDINSVSAMRRWPGLGMGCLARQPFCHLPYATGTNFGIWRDVFEAIGGWDEDYRGGGEDANLCWRAQLQGYTLVAAGEAVVHYRLRAQAGAIVRQNYGYGKATARLRRDFHGTVRSGGHGDALLSSGKTALAGLMRLRDADERVKHGARAAFRLGQLVGATRVSRRFRLSGD